MTLLHQPVKATGNKFATSNISYTFSPLYKYTHNYTNTYSSQTDIHAQRVNIKLKKKTIFKKYLQFRFI